MSEADEARAKRLRSWSLDRIEQHADEIYVRDIKDGVWGSYRLTELSVEQALGHVCRWIREAL